MMNTLKVGVLLVALTAIFLLIGRAIGGTAGMVIALVLALAMNFGSYWFSDKLVLRMTRAQPVPEGSSAAGDEYGLGVRYQRPLSKSWIFRADAMVAWRSQAQDLMGVRMEMRYKF